MVQNQKYQDGVRTFVVLDQLHEISSPKSVNNQRRDVTGGIQPRFVYQFVSPDYYEQVEDWEVEENINIDVVEKIEKNYLRSF
jgi:hypothetical protein